MKTDKLIKTRDLIHRERRRSFLNELDLFKLEDGILIGVTGALGFGFRIEGRDLLIESDTEINDFTGSMRKFLNTLPEGITLHFIVRNREGDESVLQDYEKSVKVEDPLVRKFQEMKLEAFRNHPFVKREVFLFVVIYPTSKRARSSFMPDLSITFGKKARRLSGIEYRSSKDALTSVASDIEEGFRDLGFGIRPLSDEETLTYLYELLNPCLSGNVYPLVQGHFKNRNAVDPSSLRSKLLLTPPLINFEDFYLGGYFHRTLNLLQMPDSVDLKAIRHFEDALGKEYLLSMTFEIPDQDREKAAIKRHGNFAKAGDYYSRTKDHEALKRADEANDLLGVIASSSDKLFYVSACAMVRHREKEKAHQLSREALRAFRRFADARGIEDHMNHDRLFLSFMPLQGSENPLAFLVSTEAAVHLLPIQTNWRGTDKPGLLLKTRRDEPLKLDPFDSRLQAKHAVMLGTTGSGKSFLTNHILLSFLMESMTHEVIVIDLGGSYRKLAKVLKGSYLEVACSEDYALNPFPAKEILFPEEKSADSTFLQFLKELLQRMICPGRVWSASEKMILEKAICQVYAAIDRTETPLLGDVENVFRDFKDGDEEDRRKAYSYAKELALFTQGEYGKILNRKGRFDMNARFTVFDLRKISQYPELQEILLLIIPFALRRKFENLSLKKMLVLDECWHLLKETQGTDLIELFYRTARKFNGAVYSISQNPEDFLDSKIAGVMINNSPVKYILRLKKGHEKLSLFGLNENEIEAVKDLEIKPGRYSEIFIKFDTRGVIAKLVPNPFEYWIATTDAGDLAEEGRLRDKLPYDTPFQILEKLSREYPNGIHQSGEYS